MAETETFQHYQVLKHPDGSLWELGRGAMGVTYKAFDTNLRCQVALKVINAAYLDSDMARQRFLREARAAAGLSHPNVASVFHLGEEGGNYFYAMEFINGETLEAFVRRHGPLPPAVALRITLQVARALRAASREGLVHRDIKPANLMLLHEEDGDEEQDDEDLHVKVIDFGLAKVSRKDGSEASATLTTAGFVGTPHFASPEQLEEKDLDVRSDIYSLGVTLWYMLTGRPPFSGSMVQIMSQHLTRTPPFGQLENLPPAVVHLLERMLEKDAAKRPQTATDLRREIEATTRTLRADAGPGTVGPGMRGTAPARRKRPLIRRSPRRRLPKARRRPRGASPAPAAEPATGVVLAGRYRILRTVADGAHGTLFQALELDHGHPVALKVLKPGVLTAPEDSSAPRRRWPRRVPRGIPRCWKSIRWNAPERTFSSPANGSTVSRWSISCATVARCRWTRPSAVSNRSPPPPTTRVRPVCRNSISAPRRCSWRSRRRWICRVFRRSSARRSPCGPRSARRCTRCP